MKFSAAGPFSRFRHQAPAAGSTLARPAGGEAASRREEERKSSEAIHRTSIQMVNRMAEALERRNARAREGMTAGLPTIKPR